MANNALTTTFTPPASCLDNVYTLYAGTVYEKDISILSSECYPSSFHQLFTEQIPYSPGVCPSGYSYGATADYGNDATAALCCPSGMTASDMGCFSQVNAPTELYVDGSTITVDQAQLAIHGVYIAWGPSGQPDASSTAASSSSQAVIVVPVFHSSSYAVASSTSAPAPRSTSQSSSDPPRSSSSAASPESSSDAARSTSHSASTSKSTARPTLQSSNHRPSPTSATASDSSGSPHPVNKLSTGAKAGIGVGVTVAGLAVIAVAAWFILARKRKQREGDDDMHQQPELLEKRDPEAANKAHHISELSTEGGRSELDSAPSWYAQQSKNGNGRVELDS